jgi:hypothetical protein
MCRWIVRHDLSQIIHTGAPSWPKCRTAGLSACVRFRAILIPRRLLKRCQLPSLPQRGSRSRWSAKGSWPAATVRPELGSLIHATEMDGTTAGGQSRCIRPAPLRALFSETQPDQTWRIPAAFASFSPLPGDVRLSSKLTAKAGETCAGADRHDVPTLEVLMRPHSNAPPPASGHCAER